MTAMTAIEANDILLNDNATREQHITAILAIHASSRWSDRSGWTKENMTDAYIENIRAFAKELKTGAYTNILN